MASSELNGHAGLPKLNDANNAGTKHSAECTLILTEGDSAMSLAVAGLAVIGRDSYGVFPLRLPLHSLYLIILIAMIGLCWPLHTMAQCRCPACFLFTVPTQLGCVQSC